MSMQKITDDQLRMAVESSNSVAEAIRSLGLRAVSGSYSHYASRIKALGIDRSHHHRPNKGTVSAKRLPASEILLKRADGRRTHAVKLRRALIDIGRPYICEKCGQLPEWQGNNLTLDVDHINQDWMDDREENLRFLCPNCHSQFTRNQVGPMAIDGRRRNPDGTVVNDLRKLGPWNKGLESKDRAVTVSDEELKSLVWSKTMRDAAKDFKISDVALKKECKRRGIQTPPRGYWIRK
jgi:predicted RNA-binding Zn-ribbon protein involved in translation (DUF1610 family)